MGGPGRGHGPGLEHLDRDAPVPDDRHSGAFTTFSAFSLISRSCTSAGRLRSARCTRSPRSSSRSARCSPDCIWCAASVPPPCLAWRSRACPAAVDPRQSTLHRREVIDRGVDVAAGDRVAYPEQLEAAVGVADLALRSAGEQGVQIDLARFEDWALSSKYSSSAGRYRARPPPGRPGAPPRRGRIRRTGPRRAGCPRGGSRAGGGSA